jgi:hypothetical protein
MSWKSLCGTLWSGTTSIYHPFKTMIETSVNQPVESERIQHQPSRKKPTPLRRFPSLDVTTSKQQYFR